MPTTRKIHPSDRKVLVFVGAEGAHIDWFRLPYRSLCRHGTVIGLQRLQDDFVPVFAGMIESRTGVGVEPLQSTHIMSPGSFYLGNASREADFRLSSDESGLEINITGLEVLDWKWGVQSWLARLAEQARESMTVCFLSGIDGLSDSVVSELLSCNARVVLSPTKELICTQMVDSISPYSGLFPSQVIFSTPDALAECL